MDNQRHGIRATGDYATFGGRDYFAHDMGDRVRLLSDDTPLPPGFQESRKSWIRGESIVIISQNRLQIEGDVHGDVRGKEVTIGPDGSVTGKISAERIEVHGRVHGAIRATLIVVHSTANVDAEIVHEQLSVAEGAKVEGRLKRSRDASELIPDLDPIPYLPKQVTTPVLDSRPELPSTTALPVSFRGGPVVGPPPLP